MLNNLSIFKIICINWCVVYAAAQYPEFKPVTEIPSDIPRCREVDQNLNECIRSSFQQMVPRTINGIPELNIPPTDPLQINKTNFEFANNFGQGRVQLRNVNIVGLSGTVFESVEYTRDGDKFNMVIKSKTPELVITGRYKADVTMADNRLNAKGDFNVTMIDIDATSMPEGEWYERDGHRYIRLLSFNIDPTLGNMRIRATGLTPNPVLNDALVDFANQNWRNVYKSIIPETRSTWEQEFLRLSNEYFSHLPFDELLLKD